MPETLLHCIPARIRGGRPGRCPGCGPVRRDHRDRLCRIHGHARCHRRPDRAGIRRQDRLLRRCSVLLRGCFLCAVLVRLEPLLGDPQDPGITGARELFLLRRGNALHGPGLLRNGSRALFLQFLQALGDDLLQVDRVILAHIHGLDVEFAVFLRFGGFLVMPHLIAFAVISCALRGLRCGDLPTGSLIAVIHLLLFGGELLMQCL